MIKPVIIIAEAGVNHNGSIELAKELIDIAAKAKVDYVKFQSFIAQKVISAKAEKANYQKVNDNSATQLEMVKKYELTERDHIILSEYCKKKGVKFLSTAFDIDSLEMLIKIGIDMIKIPSGEITNLPYLRKIPAYEKHIILSTGMAYLGEIETAIRVLVENGQNRDDITVLHCNTEYPTPMEDVNLMAMLTIRDGLRVKIGYSDHTLGIEVPIAAVALGANVIEKHFTTDKTLPGPDHKASLEPEELFQMVQNIRNIEKAISSNGLKEPSKSERPNITIARKSIHTNKAISKGSIIKDSDLIMKRPGTGISPMLIDIVVGRIASRDLEEDYCLEWSDLQ
jgi:N-acetylneuraminate synthase